MFGIATLPFTRPENLEIGCVVATFGFHSCLVTLYVSHIRYQNPRRMDGGVLENLAR